MLCWVLCGSSMFPRKSEGTAVPEHPQTAERASPKPPPPALPAPRCRPSLGFLTGAGEPAD